MNIPLKICIYMYHQCKIQVNSVYKCVEINQKLYK